MINNKYKKWHDNIITNAQSRVLKGYKEVHHILPKSLGGSNDKFNLVELTAREHFLVHLLLCKFTVGQAKSKMFFALNAMMTLNNRGMRKFKYNSKAIEKVRKAHSEYMKINNPSFREDVKTKIGLKSKGRKCISPKYWTGKKLSKEHKENIRKSSIGKNKGKKYYWVKNENISKLIPRNKLQEYIDLGFIKGRINNFVTEEFKAIQSQKKKDYWNRRLA